MSARKIMHKCIDCGKERLVEIRSGEPRHLCCISCGKRRKGVVRLPNNYKPIIGEIRTGTELKSILHFVNGGKYVASKCNDCEKVWWANIRSNRRIYNFCSKCTHKGSRNYNWSGGTYITLQGYTLVTVAQSEFWFPMTQKTKNNSQSGYVPEHRLVMAKHLSRCLESWEHVHHKNGIRDDNRIENLELTMQGAHSLAHSKGYKDGYVKGLVDGRNQQIEELKEQNRELLQNIKLLHWHLKEAGKI